jgi:hypothetical protein
MAYLCLIFCLKLIKLRKELDGEWHD